MDVAFAKATFDTVLASAVTFLTEVLPLVLAFAVGLACVYVGYRLFKRFTGIHK